MRKLFLLVLCSVFLGCSMAPLGTNVVRNTPLKTNNNTSKTISVAKLVDTTEVNKVIGKYYAGVACVRSGDSYWRGNDRIFANVTNITRNKLNKQGYSVIGKEDSPFNDEYNKQSELLLGGKLIEVKSNTCYSREGIKGEVYVKVQWEVYDVKTKNIVLSLISEGNSSITEFKKGVDFELYEQAFDMAIDNMLADKTFYALLTGGK